MPRKYTHNPPKLKWKEKRREMILTMRKQGVKIKEICNLTGLCERSVLANLTGEKQNFKFNVSLSIMAYNREEAMALLKKRLKRDYIDYVEYLKKLTK